jgi:hypothetical protein
MPNLQSCKVNEMNLALKLDSAVLLKVSTTLSTANRCWRSPGQKALITLRVNSAQINQIAAKFLPLPPLGRTCCTFAVRILDELYKPRILGDEVGQLIPGPVNPGMSFISVFLVV